MCGRFTMTLTLQEVAEIIKITEEIDMNPRYNIAPIQDVPVIVNEEQNGQKHLKMFQWGLIPYWSKDPAIGNKMINARAETIDTKTSFKHCFQRQRCLILADGFYEWKREGKSKIPYRFMLDDRRLFGFAGIWDTWKSPDGQAINTCSIITTSPNQLMSSFHDRMPVILEQDKEETWLDPSRNDTEYLKALLVPYPTELMKAYRVSSFVNSPKYDTIECIQPINEPAKLFE